MKTVRIKTANRRSSIPKAKLRKVVAAAYAKRLPLRMSKEDAQSLTETFIPVIITRNKLKK